MSLIFQSFAFADDTGKGIAGFDPVNDVIAENYEAGAWLIYDCNEGHWTCVLEEYYLECKEKRDSDRLTPETLFHSCAPIEKFPTKKSCFQRQLFLTSHNFGQRFCIKEKWKEKAIEL